MTHVGTGGLHVGVHAADLASVCLPQTYMCSTCTARGARLNPACDAHLDPAVSLCQDLQPSLSGQVLGDDHAVLATLIVHLKGEGQVLGDDHAVLAALVVHLKGGGGDDADGGGGGDGGRDGTMTWCLPPSLCT